MSLPPVARRSLAVLASTALLSSGAAGLFTGTALAANANVPTGISPKLTNNSGDTQFTITGTGFTANGSDVPLLAPEFPSAYSPNATPGLVGKNDSETSTSLTGTVPTTNAAPGVYDVYTYNSGVNGGNSPKCPGSCTVTIASSGAPSVSGVMAGASTGNKGRGANALDLSGSYLARASYVRFFQANGTSVDTGITFKTGDPNDTSSYSGYVSSTLLRGNYALAQDNSFTPGKHFIKVTNTLGETGAGVEFWQPFFQSSGVSPNSSGAGTTAKTITITGVGIRAGSTLSVQRVNISSNPLSPKYDVSTGAATVSPDGTSISAPITIDPGADTSVVRSVSVTGPDGGNYTVGNAFTITKAPTVSSVSPEALGQGADHVLTISGSNFASGNTPSTTPVFTIEGTGVTTHTISSTNISAQVEFVVAPDATIGDHAITVTNPDGGQTTLEPTGNGGDPFTVEAGPTISSVAPASAAANTSKAVTITGGNFDSKPTPVTGTLPTVDFAPVGSTTADPSITHGTITVTKGNQVQSTPDKIATTVNVAANATPGLRDVIVTNTSDYGRAICAGCFGVDNLTPSPTTGANTGTKSITFTANGTIPSGSTVKLIKAGVVGVQPDIVGTSLTQPTGSSIQGVFDLTDAATGPYSALVTTPTGSFACSSCFTVTSAAPTVTSITPANGGQGAVNRAATIVGTNFSRGMQVTLPGLTVHDIVFVSNTQLTVQIDIPTDATTGAKNLTVANNDGSGTVTKNSAYTVDAAPTVTQVAPASLGQGAKGAQITVTGTGFVKGADAASSSTADFGPGITVTAVTVTPASLPLVDPTSTLVATVDIAPDAALTKRDVTVVNPDGGSGKLAQAFTVNPGPTVTSISPAFVVPGAPAKSVTITGTNFSTTSNKTAVPTTPGVTYSNIVVTATQITADASAAGNATKGPAAVTVTNPTDSGSGTCTCPLYIANVPGPVVQPHTTGVTNTSVTVAWTAPSDNGGAPITDYVASAKKTSGGKPAGNVVTVNKDTLTATITGLATGTSYTVTVVARNVVGAGAGANAAPVSTTGPAPSGPSFLSSTQSPGVSTSGAGVTLSGKLLRASDGKGISGAVISLTLTPDLGPITRPKVLTDSTGAWRYAFRPVYNVRISTAYAGDASHDGVTAKTYGHNVATRVAITSPRYGASTSALVPLVVKGTVSPNKSGSRITLYRWNGSTYVGVAAGTVASDGSYSLTYRIGSGNYYFRTGIGATSGNIAGYSPPVLVHRT